MKKDKLLLAAFFLIGTATLIYEIVWSDLLQLAVGNTVYSVSLVLTSMMAGFGLGGYAYSKFLHKLGKDHLLFTIFSFIIAASGISIIAISNTLPYLLFNLIRSLQNFSILMFIELIILMAAMLIPASLLGALFPIASKLYSENRKAGEIIGSTYSANNFGAIAGSIISGAILIPVLGWKLSLMAASVLAIFSGLLVFLTNKSHKKIIYPLLFFVLLFIILSPDMDMKILNAALYQRSFSYNDFDSVRNSAASMNILYARQSPYGLVNVIDYGDDKGIALHVQGKSDASTSPLDMSNQKMLAYLPMLLHPNPKDVAVIGLGSGVTLGTTKLFEEVKNSYVMEINPAVIEAERFFKKYNNDALNDSRLTVIVDDARNYLIYTDKKFDVITSEPSNPWITSTNSNLFTKEFFHAANNKLKDGGLFVQWIPFYDMSPSDFKTILKTFSSEFKYTTVWFGSISRLDVLLIGSDKEITIDYSRFKKYFEKKEFAEDAKSVGFDNPVRFLSFTYFMNNNDVRKFVKDTNELNTDDKPILEFSTPLRMIMPESVEESFSSIKDFAESAEIPLKKTYDIKNNIAYFYPQGIRLPLPDSSDVEDVRISAQRQYEITASPEGARYILDTNTSEKSSVKGKDFLITIESLFGRDLSEQQLSLYLPRNRIWQRSNISADNIYYSVFDDGQNKAMMLGLFCKESSTLNKIMLTAKKTYWKNEFETELLGKTGCIK